MSYRYDAAVVGVYADEARLGRIADALRVARFGSVMMSLADGNDDVHRVVGTSRIVLFGISEAACASDEMRALIKSFQPMERLKDGHVAIPVLLEEVTRVPPQLEDRSPLKLHGNVDDADGLSNIADRVRGLAKDIAAGRGQIPVPPRLVFGAMPFGDDGLDDIYETCVKQPVESLGIACRRGDDPQGGEPIVAQVKELIDKSQLVIAQLSGSNPNVLWEIGYAHARERPLILIQQTPWPRDAGQRRRRGDGRATFMVRHLRVEMYTDDEAGRADLRDRILRQVSDAYRL